MKIYCQKSSLVDGVSTVARAIPSKTTMTILQCILIVAANGEIRLMANNVELGIKTRVEGDIKENGIVAIDAKIIESVVRRLPDGTVSIETDSAYRMRISCQNAKFNLLGKSGDDFTYIPEIERQDSLTISQYTLKEVINQTIFCISQNDNNKLMTGVLFEITGKKLRVAALDGHRIAIRNIELRQEYGENKLVIPGNTLNEISRILSGEVEKSVNISYNEKNIIFEFDETVVFSRLIEGEYFNLDQMLSRDYEISVGIERKPLIDSIDRATLLVKEGDRKPVIMSFTDHNLEMRINSSIGSMNETIPIDKNGPDLMIGFNPRFMIEALRAIDDDKIFMYMSNSKAPCFIWDEAQKYNYVILPINFNTVR